ncbi:hypothetical protein [Haladaptatus cibarius]|uniref:hypothetical protein n=1 Tax=Haladaptatus cibarius TaxID=453847 RepID=UPI0006791E86|nr:hypothetical protein [Haladaptatus cibarius]
MEAQPHQASGNDTEPRDDLDVAFSIIRSSEYSDLLEQINLGTGYYDDEDIAMQMRSVRKGLVTDIAFSETLRKRAVQETKVKLADEGFSFYNEMKDEPQIWKPLDDDDIDEHGRTTALFERGNEIWNALADSRYSLSVEQAAAIDEKTSLDPFKPIFNSLAAAYHETTKSKGARLQDNYFGRVRRNEIQDDADTDTSPLLGRGRAN